MTQLPAPSLQFKIGNERLVKVHETAAAKLTSLLARQGRPGRAALDPRLAIALWLYATLEGVGSARQLAIYTSRQMNHLFPDGNDVSTQALEFLMPVVLHRLEVCFSGLLGRHFRRDGVTVPIDVLRQQIRAEMGDEG